MNFFRMVDKNWDKKQENEKKRNENGEEMLSKCCSIYRDSNRSTLQPGPHGMLLSGRADAYKMLQINFLRYSYPDFDRNVQVFGSPLV